MQGNGFEVAEYSLNNALKLDPKNVDLLTEKHRIVTGEDRLRAGEITRRQLRGEQRDFITLCTGEQLPPLEEMDMTDLELAALALVDFYLSPAKTIYPNI